MTDEDFHREISELTKAQGYEIKPNKNPYLHHEE